MIKKLILLVVFALTSYTFFTESAYGAYYCVQPGGSGETSLQGALTAAQTSGESDVIRIIQGIYNGNFTYTSDQGHNLSLFGGYTASCAGRVLEPANTVLDGGKTDRVLYLNNSSGGDITVEGLTIQNGETTEWGGGVWAESYFSGETAGDITFNKNIIIGNTADGSDGGGVYANSESNTGTAGSVTFTDNTITQNTADYRGGFFARSQSSTGNTTGVTLIGNTITRNTATEKWAGGSISSSANTSSESGFSGNVTIKNNTITGNSAPYTAGIYIVTSEKDGTCGDIILVNNIIADNVGDYYTGVRARINMNGSAGTPGTITFTNNTITRNTASVENGGVEIERDGNTVNFYNNIIWGNTSPSNADIAIYGSGNAYSYNNDYSEVGGSWNSESGETNVDPQFIDPEHGDFRLRSNSPIKDAGLNSADEIPSNDFEGDTRILDLTVDIGADEVSVVTTCVSNPTELQTSLTSAKSNGKGDVIMVQQGTYTFSGGFFCDSSEGNNFTLLGGYTSGCAKRVVNPNNTILDGQSSNRALSLTDSAGGSITLDGFTIQNGLSTAQGGGAEISASASSGPAGDVTIRNNIFKGNTSNFVGGGIVAYTSTSSGNAAGDVTVVNNIASGNSAWDLGGGIYAGSYTLSGGAAGTVTCTNNTAIINDADEGGGVYLRATGTPDGIIYAYNNIIWGNTGTSSGGDIYLNKGSGSAYGYNNNYSDLGGASWDYSNGNIDASPLVTGNYHLKSKSSCIDAGTNAAPALPSTDFEGDERILDGNRDGTTTTDIGADEYIPKGVLSFLMLLLN